MIHFEILRVFVLTLPKLHQDLLQLVNFLIPDAVINFVFVSHDSLLQLPVLLLLSLFDRLKLFAILLAILVSKTFIDEWPQLLSHLHQSLLQMESL